eukprot:350843-Chlamydomonas_euryale.AAC.1
MLVRTAADSHHGGYLPPWGRLSNQLPLPVSRPCRPNSRCKRITAAVLHDVADGSCRSNPLPHPCLIAERSSAPNPELTHQSLNGFQNCRGLLEPCSPPRPSGVRIAPS